MNNEQLDTQGCEDFLDNEEGNRHSLYSSILGFMSGCGYSLERALYLTAVSMEEFQGMREEYADEKLEELSGLNLD